MTDDIKILKMKALIETVESSSQPIKSPTSTLDEKEWSLEEKKEALGLIGKYNEYGNHLRREHNLMEIAHTLSRIVDAAEKFSIQETTDSHEDGWFDSHTVKKDMQTLRKTSDEFNKLAKEAHVIQQRMEALFENCGFCLNRYFEINDISEGTHPAVSKIVKK